MISISGRLRITLAALKEEDVRSATSAEGRVSAYQALKAFPCPSFGSLLMIQHARWHISCESVFRIRSVVDNVGRCQSALTSSDNSELSHRWSPEFSWPAQSPQCARQLATFRPPLVTVVSGIGILRYAPVPSCSASRCQQAVTPYELGRRRELAFENAGV